MIVKCFVKVRFIYNQVHLATSASLHALHSNNKKQIIETKQNMIKNQTGRKQTSRLFTGVVEELNWWSEWDSN